MCAKFDHRNHVQKSHPTRADSAAQPQDPFFKFSKPKQKIQTCAAGFSVFFSFHTTPTWQHCKLGDKFPWKQLWHNVNRERRKFRARMRGSSVPSGLELWPSHGINQSSSGGHCPAAHQDTLVTWARVSSSLLHLPSASGQPWPALSGAGLGGAGASVHSPMEKLQLCPANLSWGLMRHHFLLHCPF